MPKQERRSQEDEPEGLPSMPSKPPIKPGELPDMPSDPDKRLPEEENPDLLPPGESEDND